MIRFYAPDIEGSGCLPEPESVHCVRVLRMRAGDVVNVVDGLGNEYVCEITDANPRHTGLAILEKKAEERHWKPRITLAVAPTKNFDRMEWLVEKAVEIGVDRVVFVDCDHNVRRVVKRERVEKIMVSAMKQSLKSLMPDLDELVPLKEFLESDTSTLKYMGYCSDEVQRREFAREYDGVSDVTLLIGPEGDFSPSEVETALTCGFMPVTFGNTRLRTETAALYSLCAAHAIITQACR